MALPPRWKIRRELVRVRDQVWRGVTSTLYDPPRQFLYDRIAPRLVRVERGELSLTERVAVFVLYQPRGLLRSTHCTLEHLDANGWSIVVVTNAPLSGSDLANLRSRSSVIIERPNVGYDFGAYREGIRYLTRNGHRLDRLTLMNDSTWFPLRDDDDTLARMEASTADVVGQVFKTESTERRGHDHLESHLLMFGPEALQNPAFGDFWANYVMSDSRVTTIRNGEKGLSQELANAGLRLEGLLSREKFLMQLECLEDDELADVARNIVHHRRDADEYCASILRSMDDDISWRRSLIDWISNVLSNSRQHLISTTFVAPAMRYGGMGFVKKAKDIRFHLARQKVLEMEKMSMIAPLNDVVRAEIEEAIAAWGASSTERLNQGAANEGAS